MARARRLGSAFDDCHNFLRNHEGLQPAEALDEMVKLLLCLEFLRSKETRLEFIDKNSAQEVLAKAIIEYKLQDYGIVDIQLSDPSVKYLINTISTTRDNYQDLDFASHALRSFIGKDARRGLGVFLTPEPVVETVVDYIGAKGGIRILDLAAGTGTFLKSYLDKCTESCRVSVFEKNPKMMLLAKLNLMPYEKYHDIDYRIIDSLTCIDRDNYYDLILTNPPFGVSSVIDEAGLLRFKSLKSIAANTGQNTIPSELLFLEMCFQLLKPGGELAIVLPKSIATNVTLQKSREVLGSYGYVDSLLLLPPETFALTGTQVTTIVLFAYKYKKGEDKNEIHQAKTYTAKSIGYDSTGRETARNDLPDFALLRRRDDELARRLFTYSDELRTYDSFAKLPDILTSTKKITSGNNYKPLRDICEVIRTGKTPSRSKYSESGFFLIKVGNLTGSGIDWCPRDRNFISEDEMLKRLKSRSALILEENDILLTSSAHNSSYIAKKVDLITDVPDFVDMPISFVGEVMLVRPNQKLVCPFMLLSYLRLPSVSAQIRAMVRGQTAHLHSSDLENLMVDMDFLTSNENLIEYSRLVRDEISLSRQVSEIAFKQRSLATTIESLMQEYMLDQAA